VRRIRPELWRQNNWLLHYDNALSHTYFFTWECFAEFKTVVSHPPYLSVLPPETCLFPRLKGHHFDTTGVIEAELHAVLNTFTKLDLQDAF
jgi:hypothetical protein